MNITRTIAPATTTTTTTTPTTLKPTNKIVDPHISTNGGEFTPLEQQSKSPKKRLSQDTVAWITGGICVGSIALILTLACGCLLYTSPSPRDRG